MAGKKRVVEVLTSGLDAARPREERVAALVRMGDELERRGLIVLKRRTSLAYGGGESFTFDIYGDALSRDDLRTVVASAARLELQSSFDVMVGSVASV